MLPHKIAKILTKIANCIIGNRIVSEIARDTREYCII